MASMASLARRVIAAFGGLSETARALGHRHVTTVDGWQRTGRIPYWRFSEIRAAASKAGVDLPKDFPRDDGKRARASA